MNSFFFKLNVTLNHNTCTIRISFHISFLFINCFCLINECLNNHKLTTATEILSKKSFTKNV